MLPTNRLKLGPKRKDTSAFQRLHKLHSAHQSENVQQTKVETTTYLTSATHLQGLSQTSILSQVDRNTYVGQPTCLQPWNQQTKCNRVASSLPKVAENGILTDRTNQRQSADRDELLQRCAQLQAQLTQQQNQNKEKLEENSIKEQNLLRNYQELEEQLRMLANQHQQLQQEHQKLAVEFNNFDKNYYDQEINRLRTQCEQLQIQNIQQTHQLQKSQQSSKDAQNQLKKKQEEIKALQKCMEKQKMGIVQSRAQSSQKDRCFRLALEESEAANQVLCRSVEQMARQLQREEKMRKQKENIIQSQQLQIQAIIVRGKDAQAKYLQTLKSYEEHLNEMTKRLLTLQKQEEAKNRQSQITINRLSTDLNSLRSQQAQNLAAEKLESQARQSEFKIEAGLKIVRLQEQLRQLKEKGEGSEKIIGCLQTKLKDYYSPQQYAALERRCKELEEKRLTSARYYQEKLYNYQKENDKLRLEKSTKLPEDLRQNVGFDEILKKTIEESQSMRDELKRMSEVLASAKEEAAEVRSKQKNYLNELQILRKKSETSSKNFQIELQVERQKLINEIESVRRKLSTIEKRLEYKISECKQKDDFIKSFLIGRSELQERQIVLSELERIFSQQHTQH